VNLFKDILFWTKSVIPKTHNVKAKGCARSYSHSPSWRPC